MGLVTPPPSGLRRSHLLWLALPIALMAGGGAGPRGANRGIRVMNGMRAWNGLAGGAGVTDRIDPSAALTRGGALMATADGRTTVGYVVRCALPAGRAIAIPAPGGVVHTFQGQVGLAPEWEAGACGPTCQRWVSACLLSMINTAGQHHPLWMAAPHAAIGWGQDARFPLQEGAFFGNLFASPPTADHCGGRDFGTRPIPGRIGSAQAAGARAGDDGSRSACAARCTAHGDDGFEACAGWKEVITVWHR